jgi:hypothetical protein
MAILVLPDHFWILTAFSQAIFFFLKKSGTISTRDKIYAYIARALRGRHARRRLRAIGHRTAILKICDSLPGNLFLVKETVNLDNFRTSPS